jgi:hypothetical protein
LVVEAGALAREQLIALRRDLTLDGECASSVVVIQGTATVTGKIAGDLVVLGGDALLQPGAEIGGNVHVLGGSIVARGGAVVAGAQVAYPTAPRTLLLLLEGPSLGMRATSRTVIGLKLALAAAWLLLAVILLLTGSRQVGEGAALVTAEPFRCFFAGLTAVLAAVSTIVLLAAVVGEVVGVPLLVLVVLFALLLKLWGTVAVFQSASGAAAAAQPWRRHRRAGALRATLIGLSVLTVIKLVPALGVWVWTIVTLIGVGAALRSKFGLVEPWLAERGHQGP